MRKTVLRKVPAQVAIDTQGDSYMARNWAIEDGWATPDGLQNHQHCEVLKGQCVAESLTVRKVRTECEVSETPSGFSVYCKAACI